MLLVPMITLAPYMCSIAITHSLHIYMYIHDATTLFRATESCFHQPKAHNRIDFIIDLPKLALPFADDRLAA